MYYDKNRKFVFCSWVGLIDRGTPVRIPDSRCAGMPGTPMVTVGQRRDLGYLFVLPSSPTLHTGGQICNGEENSWMGSICLETRSGIEAIRIMR